MGTAIESTNTRRSGSLFWIMAAHHVPLRTVATRANVTIFHSG